MRVSLAARDPVERRLQVDRPFENDTTEVTNRLIFKLSRRRRLLLDSVRLRSITSWIVRRLSGRLRTHPRIGRGAIWSRSIIRRGGTTGRRRTRASSRRSGSSIGRRERLVGNCGLGWQCLARRNRIRLGRHFSNHRLVARVVLGSGFAGWCPCCRSGRLRTLFVLRENTLSFSSNLPLSVLVPGESEESQDQHDDQPRRQLRCARSWSGWSGTAGHDELTKAGDVMRTHHNGGTRLRSILTRSVSKGDSRRTRQGHRVQSFIGGQRPPCKSAQFFCVRSHKGRNASHGMTRLRSSVIP